MTLTVAIQMDHVASIDISGDSTFVLALEAQKRGHKVLHYEPGRLAMRDGRIVQRGAPYNIYNRPVDKAAVAFFSDVNVLRGTVKGALTETPFGQFLAPGIPDGSEVDIVFRPQHIGLDFDRNGRGPNATELAGTPARGVVQRARFMGSESLVEYRMDFNGEVLKATVPNVFLPKPGTPMWLTVRRDRCFVFPA